VISQIGTELGRLAIGVRGHPPVFSDVWQCLDLEARVVDVWQGKELAQENEENREEVLCGWDEASWSDSFKRHGSTN
jgi:hypothetical protein